MDIIMIDDYEPLEGQERPKNDGISDDYELI